MANLEIESEDNLIEEMENESQIRKDIISFFRDSKTINENEIGVPIKLFCKKKYTYFLLYNEQQIKEELIKMEHEGLIIISNTFISFTEKGKEKFFS